MTLCPGVFRSRDPLLASLTLGVAVVVLAGCAHPLDRAWRAWERGEIDRSSNILDRHVPAAPPEALALRARHLRLLLAADSAPAGDLLADGIDLLRTAGNAVADADRLALAQHLLVLATEEGDGIRWAEIAVLAPAELDLERSPLVPGLLALLPHAPERAARSIGALVATLEDDERLATLTAIDLALYRAHGTVHRAAMERVVVALGRRADAMPGVAPIVQRHHLFARLERNRGTEAGQVAEALTGLSQTAPQLAREAELRGLHRAARALWTHHAGTAQSTEDRADALCEAAANAYRQGDQRGARRLLDDAILATAPDPTVVLRASEVSSSHGDIAFAELVLDRASVEATCEALVPLSVPRLRLQLARAEDDRSLRDLRRVADACNAPHLLAEAGLLFAEVADPALALGLLLEVLERGLGDARHLLVWLPLGGASHPDAEAHVSGVLRRLPPDDAIRTAQALHPLAPAAVRPAQLELLRAHWREQPADWGRSVLLLEACEAPACTPAERWSVLQAHLSAAAHAPPAVLRASRWALEREPDLAVPEMRAVQDWLTHLPADRFPGEVQAELNALRVRATLRVEGIEAAAHVARDTLERGWRLASPDPDWVSELTPKEVVALLEAWPPGADAEDELLWLQGDALVALGRLVDAVDAWAKASSIDTDRVDAVFPRIRDRYPVAALALLDHLPADVAGTPARRGDRLDLLLETTKNADASRLAEWTGLARAEAARLMRRGVRLRREQISSLRELGHFDLVATALQADLGDGSPVGRGAILQWALDSLASGVPAEALEPTLRRAFASAPPASRRAAELRLEEFGATLLRSDSGDTASAPSEADAGRTAEALPLEGPELARALLLPAAQALAPTRLGSALPADDARRANALATRAAEAASRLGHAEIAAEAWRLAASASSSPADRTRHLEEAIAALASLDGAPEAHALLHRIVGTGGADAGSWRHAAALLLRHDAPGLSALAAQQALGQPGASSESRLVLARALRKLGMREQALVAWEDALATAPEEDIEAVVLALWPSVPTADREAAAQALARRALRDPTPRTLEVACGTGLALETRPWTCSGPTAPDPALLLALDAPAAAATSWLALLSGDEPPSPERLERLAPRARQALEPADWVRILDRYAALGTDAPDLPAEQARARAAAGDIAGALARVQESSSRSGGVELVGVQALAWRLLAGQPVNDILRARAVEVLSCERVLPVLLALDSDETLNWLERSGVPLCTAALRALVADGRPPVLEAAVHSESSALVLALADALVVGQLQPGVVLELLDMPARTRPGASLELEVATTAAMLAHGLASAESRSRLEALLERSSGVARPAERVVLWLADAGAFDEALHVASSALDTVALGSRSTLESLVDRLEGLSALTGGADHATSDPSDDRGHPQSPMPMPLGQPDGCPPFFANAEDQPPSAMASARPGARELALRAVSLAARDTDAESFSAVGCVLAELAAVDVDTAIASIPGAFRFPFAVGDAGQALALLAVAGRDEELRESVARARAVAGDTPSVLALQGWMAARSGDARQAHWFAWRAGHE